MSKPKLQSNFSQDWQTVQDKAYKAWKADSSPANMDVVLGTVQPVISSWLTRMGDTQGKMKLRAKILATRAIQSYEPGKGANLKTHVYNQLQPLMRIYNTRKHAVRVPEAYFADRSKIQDYINRYRDENGAEPSTAMISDKLSISPKRISRILGFSEAKESDMLSEKGDMLGPAQQPDATRVWADYVYHDLDDKNKRLFEWTTGYNDSPIIPKMEIAKRMNITPQAISSRLNFIHKKMQEGAE